MKLIYKATGGAAAKTADTMKIARSTFYGHRAEGFSPKEKRTGFKDTTPVVKAFITKKCGGEGFHGTYQDLAAALKAETKIELSSSRVGVICRELGFTHRVDRA